MQLKPLPMTSHCCGARPAQLRDDAAPMEMQHATTIYNKHHIPSIPMITHATHIPGTTASLPHISLLTLIDYPSCIHEHLGD